MNINKKEYYLLYNKYEKPASTLFHKYISKKLARFFTYYFLKLNITPNLMSFSTFLLSFFSVIILIFYPNSLLIKILFLLLLQFSYVIDCSDGVIARITKTSSKFGAYFDITLDRLNTMIILGGIGIYHFTNNNFDFTILISYLISSILYIYYQIIVNLRECYFPELKGYMKKEKNSLLEKVVKFIYEFIDTGIFYFILSVALIFNIEIYALIFYGLISLILVLGNYAILYYKSRK